MYKIIASKPHTQPRLKTNQSDTLNFRRFFELPDNPLKASIKKAWEGNQSARPQKRAGDLPPLRVERNRSQTVKQHQASAQDQPQISAPDPDQDQTDTNDTKFIIIEIKHEGHAHFILAKEHHLSGHIDDLEIAVDAEGCPCCILSFDPDEAAAAIHEAVNVSSAKEHDALFGLADYNSGAHWGISAIALIFGGLGLTASIRNISGTWKNSTPLIRAVKKLQEHINQGPEAGVTERQRIIYKATLDSVKYSLMDTRFNGIVPGWINGAASLNVLSTIAFKNPLALPILALYAFLQTARNTYDFCRVYNHKIAIPRSNQIAPLSPDNPTSVAKQKGIEKINQIHDTKVTFYATNASCFAGFSAGSAMTFAGVLGSEALLIPGIALLILFSLITGFINNIWTVTLRSRNGPLGIPRAGLTQDNIPEEVGKRRMEKTEIKEAYAEIVNPSTLNGASRIGYQLLSAVPGCLDFGKRHLHQNSVSLIQEKQSELSRFRPQLLHELLKINGHTLTPEAGLNSQWKAIQILDLQTEFMEVLLKDIIDIDSIAKEIEDDEHATEHAEEQGWWHRVISWIPGLGHGHGHAHGHAHGHGHGHGQPAEAPAEHEHEGCWHRISHIFSSSDCCHGAHNSDLYKKALAKSGFFTVEEEKYKLKDFSDLPKKQTDQLDLALSFFLFVKYRTILSYQERGLADFMMFLRNHE